jgi:hypothetical protein
MMLDLVVEPLGTKLGSGLRRIHDGKRSVVGHGVRAMARRNKIQSERLVELGGAGGLERGRPGRLRPTLLLLATRESD